MTKHTSTAWGSVLLGLALSSAAIAQTAPTTTNDADETKPTNTQPTPSPMGTPDTTTTDTTTPHTTTPHTTTPHTMTPHTMTPHTTTPHTMTPHTTTITPPADVDVNVNVETPLVPAPDTTNTTAYVSPPTNVPYNESGVFSRIGFSLAAGGGTGGFVNDDLNDTADIGGEWDVRATIGTRSLIAFEGSYIGSAQGIDALGLDTNAILVGNGVQGALRVNATINFPVQPFAFGGAAWRRYDLTNTDTNLSDVAGSDDVLELPVGLGVAGRFNGLMLDARGEYRFSTNNDLLPVTANGADFAGMDRWGVKGTVGVEF